MVVQSRIFDELPPEQEALARGDTERAIAILEGRAGPDGEAALPAGDALLLARLHGLRGDAGRAAAILERLAGSAEAGIAAEALIQLAHLRLAAPERPLQEVEDCIARAAALAGEDARLKGMAAHARSRIHWRRSEFKQAGDLLQEARSDLERAGDDEELAKALDSLAMYHEHCGDRERALSCYGLSLSKKALVRDTHGLAITLGNLGRFHLRMNDPSTALSCLEDDLRITRRLGDRRAEVMLRINIGQALTELGRLEQAEREIGAALAMARQEGWSHQEAYALKDLSRARALGGDPHRALSLLDEALGLLPAAPPSYPRGQVLLARGDLLLDLDNAPSARAVLEEARVLFSTLGARQEEAQAALRLARIAEKLREWNTCRYYLEEGMNILGPAASPLTTLYQETFRTLMIASHEQAVPHSIGPYRILERIGAGAFGEVYRGFDARENASRENVAIKVLRLEGVRGEVDRGDRIARFRRECEILGSVSHPNVVRLIDTGEDPIPYLVEEHIGGGDLNSLMADGRLPALETVLSILSGVLSGLAALHQLGIVHRDLKPANILRREDGRPVIADFGIARMVELTALTLQSSVLGTLAYMAPEQIRGDTAGEPADIYAIGVIAYQLLTGRLPYEDLDLQTALRTVGEKPYPGLSRLRPALPPALSRCVQRCLEKEAVRRQTSAQAIREEIEAVREALPRSG